MPAFNQTKTLKPAENLSYKESSYATNNNHTCPSRHLHPPQARAEAQVDQHTWQSSHRFLGFQLFSLFGIRYEPHEHGPLTSGPLLVVVTSDLSLCFRHSILFCVTDPIDLVQVDPISAPARCAVLQQIGSNVHFLGRHDHWCS